MLLLLPVIPAPATDLTIVNITVTSVTLKWSVPYPMDLFPPGLVQKVEYQSTYDDSDKWLVGISNLISKYNQQFTYERAIIR
jgi:hypothetical protein